jgi:hypothetical protein
MSPSNGASSPGVDGTTRKAAGLELKETLQNSRALDPRSGPECPHSLPAVLLATDPSHRGGRRLFDIGTVHATTSPHFHTHTLGPEPFPLTDKLAPLLLFFRMFLYDFQRDPRLRPDRPSDIPKGRDIPRRLTYPTYPARHTRHTRTYPRACRDIPGMSFGYVGYVAGMSGMSRVCRGTWGMSAGMSGMSGMSRVCQVCRGPAYSPPATRHWRRQTCSLAATRASGHGRALSIPFTPHPKLHTSLSTLHASRSGFQSPDSRLQTPDPDSRPQTPDSSFLTPRSAIHTPLRSTLHSTLAKPSGGGPMQGPRTTRWFRGERGLRISIMGSACATARSQAEPERTGAWTDSADGPRLTAHGSRPTARGAL